MNGWMLELDPKMKCTVYYMYTAHCTYKRMYL